MDSKERSKSRTNRRHLLGAASALSLVGLTGFAADARAARQDTSTDENAQSAPAPDWTFSMISMQDPYTGTIQVPQTAPAGTRYVAAEVEIDNSSDQPLAFTPAEIRMRDQSGVDYRGGSALGTEPSINQRNLNGGERSRGWVWFTIPTETKLAEIVYVGPQPQFRITLPE